MDAATVKEWGVIVGVVLGNLVALAGLYFNYRNARRASRIEQKQEQTTESVSTLQKAVIAQDEMS